MVVLFEGFAAEFKSDLCPLKALKIVNVRHLCFKSAESCLFLLVFFACSEDVLHDVTVVAPVT